MKLRAQLLVGVAVIAGAVAVPAYAQNDGKVETVVVTGVRASVESALAIKRNSQEQVDSIVAEDIGKLPDQTVADSLQRISGVQIAHDFGEGGNAQNPAFQGVTIRGLNKVEYTLNGQEVMTAAGIRYYDVEDMPSELVKAVNVYKTTSANLTEGGIGGLVNIETYKPFDFDGFKFAADAHFTYDELPDAARPAGSVLVSDRWHTAIGELGALVDISFQQRRIREDWAASGSFVPNTTAVPGSTIYMPNGIYIPAYTANRQRLGLSAALQWRPNDDLEFYATANDSRLGTFQNQATYSGAFGGSSLVDPGSITLWPGSDYLQKGSFGPFSPGAYWGFTSIMGARDSTEYNQDYTVGFKWNALDDLSVSGSLDWQRSTYLLNVAYGSMYATQPTTLVVDNSGQAPSNRFTGVDLTDLGNYAGNSISYTQQWYTSDNTAGKWDAQWRHKLGPIDEIDFGFRYSDHEAVFNQTNSYGASASTSDPTAYPDLYELINTHNFEGYFPSGAQQTSVFWVAKPGILRDNFANESAIFGGSTLPSFNPHYLFTMSERTTAGYVEAKMDLGSLDGNFGVRFVNTSRSASGTQTDTVGGVNTYTPITLQTSRTDILPSVNLRFHFTNNLQLRFAASRTMTRPDFSSMNPNTVYNQTSQSAGIGNINLPPLYSSNYDVSLEYYFGKGGSLYAAGFTKSVHNFPFTDSYNAYVGSVLYSFSKAEASSVGGTIKGVEVGYTQFYDFLPGLWKGLGMQANYTYIDSSQPYYIGSTLVQQTTLPYLSRHAFTLVGMYDLEPVSVRVAYTWRSSFFQALYTGIGANTTVPIKQAGYGWLDASFNYDITDQITAYFDATNILNSLQKTYTGTRYAPQNYWVTGREFIIGIRFKNI